MKTFHVVSISMMILLALVNLVGGTAQIADNIDGSCAITTTSDGAQLFAKGPEKPKPDHGPTLPPDPWTPI